MLTGWWKVSFDVELNGQKVDFRDLPDDEKRRIQKMMEFGAVAGSLAIPQADSTRLWIGDPVILLLGNRKGVIKDTAVGENGETKFLIVDENRVPGWYRAGEFAHLKKLPLA